MSDLIFEVDMENVVTDKANLFTLFHNLSIKHEPSFSGFKRPILSLRIWRSPIA